MRANKVQEEGEVSEEILHGKKVYLRYAVLHILFFMRFLIFLIFLKKKKGIFKITRNIPIGELIPISRDRYRCNIVMKIFKCEIYNWHRHFSFFDCNAVTTRSNFE